MKTLKNHMPTLVILSLMMSIIGFLGSIIAFGYTEEPIFLQACIVSMNAIFGSVVFGMVALFLFDN